MNERTRPRLREVVAPFVASFLVLAAITAIMLAVRARLDKAHVALIYLLVVLGGSAIGGRLMGLALAAAAFLLFNFLFLLPYYTFTIADPLDWLVLLAFLATSVVAAELLDRQRRQAALAARRAEELDQFATLGAETLNAARAEQALAAIAQVICTTVDVERCEVFVRGDTNGAATTPGADLRLAAVVPEPSAGAPGARTDHQGLLQYIVDTGQAAVARDDGTLHLVAWGADTERLEPLDRLKAFAIPLVARGQTVGALRVSGDATFALTAEQRRVLAALGYYAALGVERSRLEQAADAAETLRRADRMKDALLAAVSHDLRTPLTTIKAVAHEIGQGAGAERARVIEEEADRLASLVEALLELSRLNAGAVVVAPELNTVDDLVGAALQRAEAILRPHPVDVDIGAEEILVGRFDFAHTLRIVVNLLENAAKYSPPGAAISVVARRRGDHVRIEIADRGRGVPASERERIFEPFYRAAGVTADVRGAGLGLSIARGLARAQHGDVFLATHDGQGSAFVLELPAGDLPAG